MSESKKSGVILAVGSPGVEDVLVVDASGEQLVEYVSSRLRERLSSEFIGREPSRVSLLCQLSPEDRDLSLPLCDDYELKTPARRDTGWPRVP